MHKVDRLVLRPRDGPRHPLGIVDERREPLWIVNVPLEQGLPVERGVGLREIVGERLIRLGRLRQQRLRRLLLADRLGNLLSLLQYRAHSI